MIDKIFNEDCLIGMQRIPDKSIDCIICDLPYGTTKNHWDCVIPFESLWKQFKRITKDNAAIVLFGQQPFTSLLVMSNINMFRYELIWEKEQGTGFLNAKKMPLKSHENILVFYDKLPTYNPQMTKGSKYNKHRRTNGSDNYGSYEVVNTENAGVRYPLSVIKCHRDFFKKHNTQKPVELIRYLIRTFSNEEETILDATIGSGTTAIAAMRENRHFIGFELEKRYYDIACKRIEEERQNLKLEFND